MIFFIWLAISLVALTLYFRQVYSRFSRHGVKNLTPVPVLGNMLTMFCRTKHVTQELDELYKGFPKERFIGRYEFQKPIVVLRDSELVKRIGVKDFENFIDHRVVVDEKVDPFFGKNLFSMKGDEWKDMRSTLSPAFTSSKIRLMVPMMMEVGDQMMVNLKKKIKESGNDYLDIDCKDLTSRYANDVIASCAFGIKIDSHTDENNEFYKLGHAASSLSFFQILLFILYAAIPGIIKRLNIRFFAKEHSDFFSHLVIGTMKNREENGVIRPDMIHLLMEAKKGKLTHDLKDMKDADAGFATVEESATGRKVVTRQWTQNDLVAQAIIFFIGGFESISTVMCTALHEIALNPEVQEKLLQEIRDNDMNNGGKFDYNSVQQMKYLDMVVCETLRLWPVGISLERLCTKDYNMGKPNGEATEDFILRKGEGVAIPIWSLHRDPQYFPNPEKFDPERFSEENKHKINPYAYLPFGVGPRNCVASRFALCEVKVMLYQLIQHMELSPCSKTCVPAQLDPKVFNLRFKGGYWLRIKSRN